MHRYCRAGRASQAIKKPPGWAVACRRREAHPLHVQFALGGFVVVVLQAILVAHYLAVELVDQFVDRRVQVGVGTFGKQVTAFDMDVAFRSLAFFFLLLFFYRQQHLDIDNLVKMPGDPVQLGGDVAAQGGGYFEAVTADRQVHEGSLRNARWKKSRPGAEERLGEMVSRHRSDVAGCAQPSERSARPIPSVLASDATPRCASMASADRQMIGDATLVCIR